MAKQITVTVVIMAEDDDDLDRMFPGIGDGAEAFTGGEQAAELIEHELRKLIAHLDDRALTVQVLPGNRS